MITDTPSNNELEGLVFEWSGSRRGVWFYVAWVDGWIWPAGIAFVECRGSHDGRTVYSIGHIYTHPSLRRRKIATRLMQRIAKDCDVITTPAGSDDGGKSLLESMGFVYDNVACCWTLHIPATAPEVLS